MKKNRILTITYNDQNISWGPAVHFLELWNNYQKNFPEITVDGIAPNWIKNGTLILEPLFRLNQIKVPNISLLRQVVYDINIAYQIVRVGRKYDCIYIRLSSFHLFSSMVLKAMKLKYFVELNGIAFDDAKHAKKTKIYSYIVKTTTELMIKNSLGSIAVSDGIKEFAESCGAKNVLTIYNGVSSELFNIHKNDNYLKTVVYVGTFTPWDGHKRLLEFVHKFPNIKFLIVGGTDNLETIKQKYKNTKNLEFLGFVDYSKLYNIYSNADAGIVLYDKGFRNNMKISSLKTLEYIASGLPIFSTNVPGQEFIFENNIGCEATDDLNESFQHFINNYESYNKQVELFRKNSQEKISWKVKAIETHLFLSKLICAE